MDRECSMHGRYENAYRILVGTPEGKSPHGRPSRRWEDNVGMDRRQIGWEVVDRMHLAENRGQWQAHLNTVKKFRVP
jgi:hypothetical protein